ERLYVDNGANYRSQHLSLVCAKLGVALIHARPYRPQGKGKIERWFKTVRAQLLTRLTEADTQSLDALNRRLWAWTEGEYHQTPHHGQGNRMKVFLVLRNLCIIPKSTLRSQRYEYRFG
ncbi:MAG: Integrase core domain-containing protein, partial [Candidatus Kentron sp. G]